MDSKTLQKLAGIVGMIKTAERLGLVVVGGIKAVAALIGHDLTTEQQNAIELAIQIDATTRLDERRRMLGDAT